MVDNSYVFSRVCDDDWQTCNVSCRGGEVLSVTLDSGTLFLNIRLGVTCRKNRSSLLSFSSDWRSPLCLNH